VIWALLFVVYVSTLGLDAAGGHDYARDESHYLLAARSLAKQRALDVKDDYRDAGWRDFDTARPTPQGRERKGALYEPHSIGLPILAAPAYAAGGERAVEVLVAALLALAFAWSYLLARRVVPDPWCLGAALTVGLSAPLLAYGTAVLPDPVAAAALAGAALFAARLRENPSRRNGLVCFALLGMLPWLGFKFVPAGVVIGWDAVRTLRRAHRPVLAIISVEVAFFSIALLVGLNEAVFGGPTPHSADVAGTSATGASTLSDYLGRTWRLVSVFLDRNYGLVRWAPVVVLAFAGVWALYRASRERLSRAIAGLDEELGVARLCAVAALTGVIVAAFFVPDVADDGFPGHQLIAVVPLSVPLVALGLRQLPRTGAALALLSVAGSVWLWVAVRSGGALLTDRPRAPWGPLTDAFPHFKGDIWPYVLLALIVAAASAPFVREEIEVRKRLS
jgi:hypothetical protein